MKKWVAILSLIVIFSGIAMQFWYSEWRYGLPTPIPKSYHPVKQKEYIAIQTSFTVKKNLPLFIHFFNPDCPCSKFNIPHFKSLVNKYSDKINFEVVVLTTNKKYTQKSIQEKFDLTIPVLFDTSIATLCGVYSTPQAVLIDQDKTLYYRGNYNKSRYCTDKKSNYAQMAIDSLLDQKQNPIFNKNALIAYGCTLPLCKQ
jgi:peroxiredoxin